MKSVLIRATVVCFLLILFSPNLTFAERKTFIKEYTYRASEDDSRNSSRVTAMREVKRLLLEELGTYLESITEVQNFQLTKDKITALTAGIVKTEIIDEKWNGEKYWIKTKIVADGDDVIKSIDKLRKDRDKLRELEDTKKRADAILEENKKLRQELAHAKGNAKQIVQHKYDNSIRELSSIEWYEIGLNSYNKGDYESAIRDFSKAIALEPKNPYIYSMRGGAYNSLERYSEAISDYNKTIELAPKDYGAYFGRGMIYERLGRYSEAIIDYNKTIELAPKDSGAYFSRGSVYAGLRRYSEAIIDFSKAIALEPKNPYIYSMRGIAEVNLEKYNEAIADYSKAIQLDPASDIAYAGRAGAYSIIGNSESAIADLKKAIQIDPAYRDMAKKDKWFDNIRNTPEFKRLIDE